MTSREERDAARKAAAEEAYREVFQVEHPDPFDPLFKFPDWVPGFFVALHRRCLRKLLKAYSRDKIKTEYDTYKARLTNESAERRDVGIWHSPSILPPLTDEFRDIAHILWALEIATKSGSEAGLSAMLGDPKEARYWQIGRTNVAAVKSGGMAKGRAYEHKTNKKSEEFFHEVSSYISQHPNRGYSTSCKFIAERHNCSDTWVRKLLKREYGITAKNFRDRIVG